VIPAAPTDVNVRIGGLEVVGADSGAHLVTVGLGSCIGVAIIDQRTGACGLAHVFLPEPPASGAKPGAGAGMYATTAVPELVLRVCGAARVRSRATTGVVAVIAGGAKMFGGRTGHDIGARNLAAVRAALLEYGIEVVSEETGGASGRTMRARGGRAAEVSVRVVGSAERVAWSSKQCGEARRGDLAAQRAA